MATEYLREKVNVLTQLDQQTALEAYQHELVVKIASQTCGDPQVDANFAANAQNSKATLLACNRRRAVYQAELAALNAELNANTAQPTA